MLKTIVAGLDSPGRMTKTVGIPLHGFTQGPGFVEKARLHEHVPCIYPIAHRYNAYNWKFKHAAEVMAAVTPRIAALPFVPDQVLVTALSDGNTILHELARLLCDAGHRVGLIHWSGPWKGPVAPVAAAFFVHGHARHAEEAELYHDLETFAAFEQLCDEQPAEALAMGRKHDIGMMIRTTEEAAAAYGRPVIVADEAGHEWLPSYNDFLVGQFYAAL